MQKTTASRLHTERSHPPRQKEVRLGHHPWGSQADGKPLLLVEVEMRLGIDARCTGTFQQVNRKTKVHLLRFRQMEVTLEEDLESSPVGL